MIYRIHIYSEAYGSEGYRWFPTKPLAKEALKEYGSEDTEIVAVRMPKNQEQFLAVMNEFAAHAENG